MAKLSDITKQLEAAVDAVVVKQAKLAEARTALGIAEQECGAVVLRVRELHAEYQAVMKDVLSFGGTVHVA